jgi:hypothetical protein
MMELEYLLELYSRLLKGLQTEYYSGSVMVLWKGYYLEYSLE